MATQISGLASGINWTEIVSEIVQADSVGVNQLQAQQNTVNDQISALGSLTTDMNTVSSDIFSLEAPSLYQSVTAASTTANSSWTVSAQTATPPGNYTVDVSTLATASNLDGKSGISAPLGSGALDTPLASLPVGTAITAGTMTVNGQQITVTTSETLQDVFNAISSATDGAVTGSYNSDGDTVSLSSSSPIVLGADNDTSNLLQALKLANGNSPTDTVTSSGALGALQLDNTIADSNLSTALTGQDGSGNGSFTINGVTIDYNIDTDSLSTLIGRINNSSAGVTASYNAADDQMVLTNNDTGNTGLGASDTSGNLLAALGLTSAAGATLQQGVNAEYSVNDGPTQTSASNTLDAAALGVSGLSVTANTTGSQLIQVTTDTSALSTAIQTFITDFNTLQQGISDDSSDTIQSDGTVTTSILSADSEVNSWETTLEDTAFSAGSGLTGSITSLDALGIDFNGTTGQLEISDSAQLQQALSQNPAAVAAFFQTAQTGFGSIMSSTINDLINQSADDQQNLEGESTDLGNQISTMQTQISTTQANLDAEFEAMETAMENYQNEESAMGSLLSSSASSGLSNIATSVNDSLNNQTNTSTNGTSTTGTDTSTTGTSDTSTA